MPDYSCVQHLEHRLKPGLELEQDVVGEQELTNHFQCGLSVQLVNY